MAIKGTIGVGNKARLLTDIEIGVEDKARRVIRAYVGDENGKARRWYRTWVTEPDLPFDFYRGAAVVYDGRIHILGGEREPRKHWSWDGETWQEESTLPYNFNYGSAIVFDGKIHIFGSTSAMNAHYSWNGKGWTQEVNTPHYFYNNNNVVIYDGKIRLVSSGYGSYSQWGFDDALSNNTWLSVWMNSGSSYTCIVVYFGLIHMFPRSGDGVGHNTWDGTTLGSDVQLPYVCSYGYAVVYHGRIHVLGSAYTRSYGGQMPYVRMHYIFDGPKWERIATLPKPTYRCPAVVYKGKIHLLGGVGDATYRKHYSWEEDIWYKTSDYFVDGISRFLYCDAQGGRWYMKVNEGNAYACVTYANGWTIPLFISDDQDAVTYKSTYSQEQFTYRATFDYDGGITWYVAGGMHAFSGDFEANSYPWFDSSNVRDLIKDEIIQYDILGKAFLEYVLQQTGG